MTTYGAVQTGLPAAVIGRSGEAPVLDMGEQIRIADMARRLVAAAPPPVEIVFTGLRTGEKLTEDLLGASEPDVRPCHPLIRQVAITALAPHQITSLARDASPEQVRTAVAAFTRGSAISIAFPAAASPGDAILARPASQPASPVRSLT